MWHPGKTTTYVRSVIEIKSLISKLQNVIQNYKTSESSITTNVNDTLTAIQIQKQSNNWQIVLTNYQQYNIDKTTMFTSEKNTISYNGNIL